MLNRRSAVIPPCSSLSLDKSAANKPKALSGSRLVVLLLVNDRAHETFFSCSRDVSLNHERSMHGNKRKREERNKEAVLSGCSLERV